LAYIIKGGREGRDRLIVLADAMKRTTAQLFDRVGSFEGLTVVDAACGGGEVSFDLAERVGPYGRVVGFDLDEVKLDLARSEASRRGLSNITFVRADALEKWPVEDADLVYARFILTHLPEPERCLARARAALAPYGQIVVEDVDIEGRFAQPANSAIQRGWELYVEAALRQGGDPFIGRRLDQLLEAAGFAGIQTELIQPFGRQGSAKQITYLTFAAIADNLIDGGLATRQEVEELLREVEAFTNRTDTLVAMPRVFQAFAVRSGAWDARPLARGDAPGRGQPNAMV
jgi:ubiquinone/menaquinone biosynthesis C-methylase UbiE